MVFSKDFDFNTSSVRLTMGEDQEKGDEQMREERSTFRAEWTGEGAER